METQTQSQPEFKGGVAAFEAALAKQESAAPETPASEAQSEAPAVIDPATIDIPAHDTVPEKFRGKKLTDAFESIKNAERFMHEKAGEAAQLRKEREELMARLAAAEQFARMTQQPPQPQKPVDPWGGANPAELVITEPDRFVNTTIAMAEQRASAAAEAAARKVAEGETQKLRDQAAAQALISTFETARKQLGDKGYDVSDEVWHPHLAKVARILKVENDSEPGALYDPNRYVNYYTAIAPSPQAKATIPAEGNPPVAAKPAAGPAVVQGRPTVSREQRQLYEQIGKAAGLSGDRLKAYIERTTNEQGGAR